MPRYSATALTLPKFHASNKTITIVWIAVHTVHSTRRDVISKSTGKRTVSIQCGATTLTRGMGQNELHLHSISKPAIRKYNRALFMNATHVANVVVTTLSGH